KAAVVAPLVEQDLQHQEQFWQDVARESKVDTQRHITNSLEALAHEGLGLGKGTGAGKGLQQRPEEKEGARETTPDTTAGAAMGAASPAARKAPTGGAKGLASPAKKGSPTKPSSKCRGRPAPRYKAPTQQEFSDKELARLLAPKRAEAVVDTGVEAGVVLKETKMVEKAQEAEAREEVVSISKRSLVLPTCHGSEERESGKGKRKASPPLSPTDKGKKRVRVVSPAAVTSELESDEDDEDKACHLSAAIEASKAAPNTEDLAGPSCQAEAAQDVGASPKGTDREETEEGSEVGLEVTPQAQPWGHRSPQWSWLPEWGSTHPIARDVSSSDKPESWVPRHRVRARFDPCWTSPPAPRVTGEAFKWLGEDLAHPVVPLQPAVFLERMRAWAAQMERILEREQEAVWAELMGLRLRYLTLRRSVEMLCNYQEDVTQALEWQEENNI
ncbi:hypothetical protein C0993_010981, partial [Termitomyces sp. T159_Od127]